MNKPIQSYDDLLREKERLQALLKVQREIVREDVAELRVQLEPITSTLGMAGKLFTRDRNNIILNASANTLIDVIMKKVLLSRAGWIARLVVPFFMKNFSSHLISENKPSLLNKLFSLFGKKRENGHPKVYSDDHEEED